MAPRSRRWPRARSSGVSERTGPDGAGGPAMRAGGRGEPYWLKQWAAESSQRSPTTVAPQKCREPSFRLACQGTSPAAAADPPTMRAGLSSAGLAPHSEGQDRREKGLDAFGQSEHLGLGGPWDTGHVLALAEPGRITPVHRRRNGGSKVSQGLAPLRGTAGHVGRTGGGSGSVPRPLSLSPPDAPRPRGQGYGGRSGGRTPRPWGLAKHRVRLSWDVGTVGCR